MGYASKNAKRHNDRISDQEKVYHCAYCKGVVLKTDHYCQYCGKKLRKQNSKEGGEMRKKNIDEILYKQLELLAEDSKNPLPDDLKDISLAMVAVSRELFMHRFVIFFISSFLLYLLKNFAVFCKKFSRRQ